VTEAVDGGLVIAGSLEENAILAKLDAAGDLVWGRAFEAGQTSALGEVWQAPGGGFVAAGWRGDEAWILDLADDGQPVAAPCVSTHDPALSVTPVPGTVSDPEAVQVLLWPSPEPGADLVDAIPTLSSYVTCSPPPPPTAIERLLAVRAGDDIALTWTPDSAAEGYHVWTVTTKQEIDLARQSSSPPARGVKGCSPPLPAPGNACADSRGMLRGSPVFYQVRGVGATTVEGP